MPPLPGPDWITPRYQDLSVLQVQSIDPRLFAALGISSRQGYAPVLLPTVQPVVVLPLEESTPSEPPAFIEVANQVAVVGQTSMVQLHNPTGSGVNLLLAKVHFYVLVATFLNLSSHNAGLLTLVTQGQNKVLGQPASAGQLRIDAAAVVGSVLMQMAAPANELQTLVFDPHFEIPPGRSILVSGAAANVAINGTFEWKEKLNAA